ncbi:MAG: Rrf2 family transcriptional regulator [Gemmataceae bacterium]
MLVTARAEYACLAMVELAKRFGDPKPVRLIEVAEMHEIPQKFLVQILLQMKAAGLVSTTRGAAGGYQLVKKPEEITLADIFAVLDRMDEPEDLKNTKSSTLRGLQKIWRGLADNRTDYLKKFKLSELMTSGNELEYVI